MKVKDWKAFQEYREKKKKQVFSSKEYKKAIRAIDELERKERKEPWMEYSPMDSLFLQGLYNIERIFVEGAERILLSDIPENTVEACLNWMVRRKKK